MHRAPAVGAAGDGPPEELVGHGRALRGYAGEVPTHVSVGDTIEVLNLGGILGKCTSANPENGNPFKAEVLGAILTFPALGDRIGRPAHFKDHSVPVAERLALTTPPMMAPMARHAMMDST